MNKYNSNFLILTQAGPKSGYGHLIRCSVIIENLILKGLSFNALMQSENGYEPVSPINFWELMNWKNKSVIKKYLALNTVVIVYSYSNEIDIFKFIFEQTGNIFFIDDLNYHAYSFGYRLQPRLREMDSNLVQSNLYQGPKIIPLRKEFFQPKRSVSPFSLSSEIKILIVLGSNISIDYFIQIAIALLSYNNKYKILILSNNEGIDIELNKLKGNFDITLIKKADSKYLSNLFLKIDLLICSGGQVIFEAIASRVAFIPIMTAINQYQTFEDMFELGVINNILRLESTDLISRIIDEIDSFLAFNKLDFMEKIYQDSIFDEFGAARLIDLTIKINEGII